MHLRIIYWTVDPHLFFTDPDPSFFLNVDLDQCGSGSTFTKLQCDFKLCNNTFE